MISLSDIITGEDRRLKRSDNPFLENGFIGTAIALFSLYRIKGDDILLDMAERYLDAMKHNLKDKVSLEINNGLSGVGLGMTWLVENGFVSGDLNIILKEIDDRIYKYSVKSLTEYYPQYESTYLDMLIYIAVRIKYLKPRHVDYSIFVRLAQMLYDHLYFNISMGFLIEPRPSNIRYKLFLFILVSWLLCRNGDNHIRNRVSNVFNEIYDIIVTIHPFCVVNKFMLHMAIDLLLPYLNGNVEKWKQYSKRLANDVSIEQMIDETLDNDMSVFHGMPYIYILLKYNNIHIPNNLKKIFIKKIEDALSIYASYEDCEKWNFVGLSGIIGSIVVLEDINAKLSYE